MAQQNYDPLLAGLQSVNVAGIDPERARSDPSWGQGQIHDQQWQLFEQRYRPMEDAAIEQFLAGTGEAAQRATESAKRGLAGATEVNNRALGRRGVTMTDDQRAASHAAHGLNAARTIGTAANVARQETRDRNMEGLGTMMSIGKGISGSAGDNLSQAAGLQSARDQQNAAASQARRQQNMQTATSLAGLGMMAAVMM